MGLVGVWTWFLDGVDFVHDRCILLIIPTIFHVLINRLDAHPKRILSCDLVDGQFLDRSYVIFPGSQGRIFPGSHASKSCDIIVAEGSFFFFVIIVYCP